MFFFILFIAAEKQEIPQKEQPIVKIPQPTPAVSPTPQNQTNITELQFSFDAHDVFASTPILQMASLGLITLFVIVFAAYSMFRLITYAINQKESNIFDTTSEGNHDESYLLGKHRA